MINQAEYDYLCLTPISDYKLWTKCNWDLKMDYLALVALKDIFFNFFSWAPGVLEEVISAMYFASTDIFRVMTLIFQITDKNISYKNRTSHSLLCVLVGGITNCASAKERKDNWGENSRKRAEQERQESASLPTQQLYKQNLSDFGILEFSEGLDSKLWLISALSTAAATHPPHKPWGRKLCTVLGAACTQLMGARIGKKDPALPILKMFLITDCCFWSERCHCCFNQPHPPLIQAPPPLAEGTSRGFKRLMPFPLHFPLFPLKD